MDQAKENALIVEEADAAKHGSKVEEATDNPNFPFFVT